jgi:hypothetical protein
MKLIAKHAKTGKTVEFPLDTDPAVAQRLNPALTDFEYVL